jgi:hypothetical protein
MQMSRVCYYHSRFRILRHMHSTFSTLMRLKCIHFTASWPSLCTYVYVTHYLFLQVGSLQERIDELAEELEAARAAAAAAAAALAPAPSAPTTAADSTHTQPAAGAAAADRRSSGGPGSPGTQLSRQSSSSKVPLMGDDTPLAELHAQVGL